MEAESRYTYIGAAALALIAALVGVVVWFKGVGGERNVQYYVALFEKQELDGLQVGGDVRLRGIKIGRVEDYTLDPDRINRVRVTLRLDRRVPIHVNTVATINRNFVTGLATITLFTREPPGDLLTASAPGERYPVIAEGRSDIDQIAGRVNELGDMAADLLVNLNSLLSPGNRAALTVTLRNLASLTGGLNERLVRLDETLARVGTAAASAGKAGDRIAGTIETSGRQLDLTLAEAQRALAEAQNTAAAATQALARIDRGLDDLTTRLDRSATGIDDQLGATVSELRVSLDALSRTLDRLQDPRAALLGPSRAKLGPGEAAR